MESRANYLMVGSFVLLLAGGLLGFVVWLGKFQTDTEFSLYDIIFTDPVTGLRDGSAVRYNGVKVGEVLSIGLDPDDPTRVTVEIEIQKLTPVREDTTATLELEGLTGGRYVLLKGGAPGSPLLAGKDGKPPVIAAGASSFERVLEGAPEVLDNVNVLLTRATSLLNDQNLDNINRLIANLAEVSQTFTDRDQDIDKLLEDAGTTMTNLRNATKSLEEMATALKSDSQQLVARADSTLLSIEELAGSSNSTVVQVGEDLELLLGTLNGTAGVLDSTLVEIQGMVAENREPIRDFTSTGLFQLSSLLKEARELIGELQRVTTEVERDPAGFIFGNRNQGYEPNK
ncbi:MAG: MlaD family protein [Pseudomonadota bacterium]